MDRKEEGITTVLLVSSAAEARTSSQQELVITDVETSSSIRAVCGPTVRAELTG